MDTFVELFLWIFGHAFAGPLVATALVGFALSCTFDGLAYRLRPWLILAAGMTLCGASLLMIGLWSIARDPEALRGMIGVYALGVFALTGVVVSKVAVVLALGK